MHRFSLAAFGIFLTFRLLSVVFVKTSFVPDEYWQSLEVSHKLAYGYGHLTWEWQEKIRSCSYPFIFYIFYSLLPDSNFVIVYVPKIFQAVLSSVGDFFAWKLAKNLFGWNCAAWTALNILSSWFLFYCSPRTITNMAEASLTICGLFYYPWPNIKKRRSYAYLWFAGASMLLRPTASVVWFPLFLWHWWSEDKFSFSLKIIYVGFINLLILLLVDKWCFGQWVLTPYNFFKFNWQNDIGALYGTHGFLWYFFIGYPVILGVQIFPFLLGVFMPALRHFYSLIFFTVLILSFLSHKEFRFLLPLLHLSLILCGAVLSRIWTYGMVIRSIRLGRTFVVIFSALLLCIHVPFSLYMGLYHQRGVIDVVQHLSNTVESESQVLFLMPCHSTPYFSYIHQNISMKFLTCEPNLKNNPFHVDEADYFFENPNKWLQDNYYLNSTHQLPTHIVMFDSLHPSLSQFLEKHSYILCFNTFHSHFPDKRTGESVQVYCKSLLEDKL